MKNNFLSLLLCMMVLVSCNHKDLCYGHDSHTPRHSVDLNIQAELQWQYSFNGPWETGWKNYDSFLPGWPQGFRCMVHYPETDKWDEYNLSEKGGVMQVDAGLKNLLVYNNDTEFVMFKKEADNNWWITTNEVQRSTYEGNSFVGDGKEKTVNMPDVVFADYIPGIRTEESLVPEAVDALCRPLVYTWYVRFEFSQGADYIALCRGAMAGVAGAACLNRRICNTENVTVLFDAEKETGAVTATVRAFGLPETDNDSLKVGLNLEVMLTNTRILDFDFDITGQMKAQPQGGVVVVKGLVITEEQGRMPENGYEIKVNGWGDYEDVPLNF